MTAADLDGDGNPDLAVALYGSNEVGLWKGDGKGGFDPVTRFSSRGRLPSKIQIADVNRDGKPDIVVSHCYSDDSIVIFYGEGQYRFSVSQEILLGKDHDVLEHEIRDLVVADFNNDKRPDLAVACHASKQVVVLMNESPDPSVPQTFRQEAYPFDNGRPRALCAADLNNDGALDLAVALSDGQVSFLIGKPEPAPAREHPEKENAPKKLKEETRKGKNKG